MTTPPESNQAESPSNIRDSPRRPSAFHPPGLSSRKPTPVEPGHAQFNQDGLSTLRYSQLTLEGFVSGLDLSPQGLSPRVLEGLSPFPQGLSPPRGDSKEGEAIRNHVRYPELVGALMDCKKVGASEHEIRRLESHRRNLVEEYQARVTGQEKRAGDPELDRLMEFTCQQLVAFRQHLKQPFDEANDFCARVEQRLADMASARATRHVEKRLEKSPSLARWEVAETDEAPAEELDDVDIVEALGDLGELKKRMMKLHGKAIAQMDIDTWKKEPKARLPAGAIQVMRAWWEKHKGSPYPSEPEKIRLAKKARLELQQVNNWFINERKRHWKNRPEEEPPAGYVAARKAKHHGVSLPKSKKKGTVAQAPRIVPGHAAAEDGLQMINSTKWMHGEMEGQLFRE